MDLPVYQNPPGLVTKVCSEGNMTDIDALQPISEREDNAHGGPDADYFAPPPVLGKRRVSVVSTNTDASISKPPTAIMNRRRSSFRSVAMILTKRFSMRLSKLKIDEVDVKPKVKLENTYKLKPDGGGEFSAGKVESIIYDVLESNLKDKTYDPITSPSTACDLCNALKTRMKEQHFTRHKIVCQVMIGQCMNQGLEAASRSIWDSATDTHAYVTYKNKSLFAIGIVHGVYYE